MRLGKFILAAVSAAALAVPALAQGAGAAAGAKVSVGAQVVDTAGNPVGTIEQVSGDLAVLSTGTNKVSLPVASFGVGEKGPVLAMTRAEVDAAPVGTIESVEGEFATVATTNSKVRLPLTAFGKGASGPVIAMSAAELDAAAKSAQPTGSN
jgi:hypothetical protein